MSTCYTYQLMLPFERGFNSTAYFDWHRRNWTLSFWFSAAYMVIIYLGQKWMANRPPFELKKTLLAWNSILAVISLLIVIRVVPECACVLLYSGFQHSVCTGNFPHEALAVWIIVFIWSKPVELLDTLFLVLRKRKIIFLHWYHHVTVLVLTWLLFERETPTIRWFGPINSFVHAIMYLYYALRAAGHKVPMWFPMTITTIQIAQMIAGVGISLMTYWLKINRDAACQVTDTQFYVQSAIYASYFVLFANYFIQTYLRSRWADTQAEYAGLVNKDKKKL